ncbi:MAG: hypothetical protein P8Y18_08490 [Candidatus Bathyarchaeota archaeon]
MINTFREGDLIENIQNIIFDVKGLVHPPDRAIAFIRYVPDPNGNRKRSGKKYSKYYNLSKRYELLKRDYPEYLVNDPIFNTILCEIPINEIKEHFQPIQGLRTLRKRTNLDKTEKAALLFMENLKDESGVQWNKLGISGSILVNIHEESSDIDLIVYGSKTGYKVAQTMKRLLNDEKNLFQPYDLKNLKELFDFRSKDTNMTFEDFVRTDSRKISHGKFLGKHFFIRFVKDSNEINEQYGDIIYYPEGNSRILATIVNDREALFTPCTYEINNVKVIQGSKVKSIKEIVSFRGRFCEQARIGERVIAEGKIERVQQQGKDDHYRLLLGSKPSDHMILI